MANPPKFFRYLPSGEKSLTILKQPVEQSTVNTVLRLAINPAGWKNCALFPSLVPFLFARYGVHISHVTGLNTFVE